MRKIYTLFLLLTFLVFSISSFAQKDGVGTRLYCDFTQENYSYKSSEDSIIWTENPFLGYWQIDDAEDSATAANLLQIAEDGSGYIIKAYDRGSVLTLSRREKSEYGSSFWNSAGMGGSGKHAPHQFLLNTKDFPYMAVEVVHWGNYAEAPAEATDPGTNTGDPVAGAFSLDLVWRGKDMPGNGLSDDNEDFYGPFSKTTEVDDTWGFTYSDETFDWVQAKYANLYERLLTETTTRDIVLYDLRKLNARWEEDNLNTDWEIPEIEGMKCDIYLKANAFESIDDYLKIAWVVQFKSLQEFTDWVYGELDFDDIEYAKPDFSIQGGGTATELNPFNNVKIIPGEGYLHVNGFDKKANIELFSITGVSVDNKLNVHEASFEGIKPGIYILRVAEGTNTQTTKVLVR